METTIESKTCTKCGRDDVHAETWEFNVRLCDYCYTLKKCNENNQEKSLTGHENRIMKWQQLCPDQYRDTETNFIDQNVLRKVTSWKFGVRGILATGSSRKGKTTSCWKLIKKLYIEGGIAFEAMTEPGFSQLAAQHSRNRTIDGWISNLCHCKLLFLDDIGHSASSAKHLEELYFVIEERTSHKRPVIATTQFTFEELQGRAKNFGGEKTVQAILNRLRDACDIVIFE